MRLPCVPEGVVHKTSPIHATGDAAQDATAIVIRWLHGVDHVQEGQLGRGLRQTIAPGSPGARLNELGLLTPCMTRGRNRSGIDISVAMRGTLTHSPTGEAARAIMARTA